jgi:hypothetical protein
MNDVHPPSHRGKTPYVASWNIVISTRLTAHIHGGAEFRVLFFLFFFFDLTINMKLHSCSFLPADA